MAASDYGVIVIKNGRPFEAMAEMGCAYRMCIDERIDYAYKLNFNGLILPEVMENRFHQRLHCLSPNHDILTLDSTEFMSRTIVTNGVVVHIKNRENNVYEINFNLDDDKYAILMGVDVALCHYWYPATKKKVKKFLRKHLAMPSKEEQKCL